MAKRSLSISFLVLGSVLVSSNCVAMSGKGVREKFAAVRHHWNHATQWGADHKELLEFAACLSHVPSILTADSQNALAVKSAALLALTATDAKMVKELFKQSHGCLAKQCVYDIPKTLLYALASYYDYVRLTGELKSLPADSPAFKHVRLSKITQFFLLGLEVMLRAFAYTDKLDTEIPAQHHRSFLLSELADWVEIWRLLSRFGILSEQDATFDERLGRAKQSLAQALSGISGDLAKRSIDLSMRDEFVEQGANDSGAAISADTLPTKKG